LVSDENSSREEILNVLFLAVIEGEEDISPFSPTKAIVNQHRAGEGRRRRRPPWGSVIQAAGRTFDLRSGHWTTCPHFHDQNATTILKRDGPKKRVSRRKIIEATSTMFIFSLRVVVFRLAFGVIIDKNRSLSKRSSGTRVQNLITP